MSSAAMEMPLHDKLISNLIKNDIKYSRQNQSWENIKNLNKALKYSPSYYYSQRQLSWNDELSIYLSGCLIMMLCEPLYFLSHETNDMHH